MSFEDPRLPDYSGHNFSRMVVPASFGRPAGWCEEGYPGIAPADRLSDSAMRLIMAYAAVGHTDVSEDVSVAGNWLTPEGELSEHGVRVGDDGGEFEYGFELAAAQPVVALPEASNPADNRLCATHEPDKPDGFNHSCATAVAWPLTFPLAANRGNVRPSGRQLPVAYRPQNRFR